MYMCIEALIKDCHKVILSQLELLKVQQDKQSIKVKGSLDLNKTSKKPMKHSTKGHNRLHFASVLDLCLLETSGDSTKSGDSTSGDSTKNPPIIQYVVAIEQVCTKMEEDKAEEFRVQVKVAIQRIQKSKPNITREERTALTKLKKDPSRMVLAADKGVALGVMNMEDYKRRLKNY